MTESLRRLRRHYDRADTSAELATAELVEPGENRMVGITIRLPQATLDAARAVADEEGIKVTALLREWVEQRLAERVDDASVVAVADLRRLIARAGRRSPD